MIEYLIGVPRDKNTICLFKKLSSNCSCDQTDFRCPIIAVFTPKHLETQLQEKTRLLAKLGVKEDQNADDPMTTSDMLALCNGMKKHRVNHLMKTYFGIIRQSNFDFILKKVQTIIDSKEYVNEHGNVHFPGELCEEFGIIMIFMKVIWTDLCVVWCCNSCLFIENQYLVPHGRRGTRAWSLDKNHQIMTLPSIFGIRRESTGGPAD